MLWAFCLFLLLSGTAQAQEPETAVWQRALASVAEGDSAGALPDLEQLVSRNPANVDYRFELALALSKVGQDGRARHHLELLNATALRPGARHAIGQLRTQIDARRKLTGYFSFGLLPESNVGKQTEDGIIIIGGVPFQLEQVGEAGVSAKINTGLSYGTRLSEHLHARVRADVSAKWNEDKRYRDVSVMGRAGLRYAKGGRSAIGGGLLIGTRWIGDAPYSDTVGGYFDYLHQIGGRGRLGFNLQLANTRHKDGTPDHNIALAHLSYSHGISANAQVRFGVFHQQTNSADATAAGGKTGLSFGADYAFRGGLIAGLDLRMSRDRRDGFNRALFSEAREDKNTAINFTLYHRDFRIFTLAPQLIVGIERNKSNNDLVDYTNKYMTVGFTRKF